MHEVKKSDAEKKAARPVFDAALQAELSEVTELADIAQEINPALKGWQNDYGRFYRSALHVVFVNTLDQYLASRCAGSTSAGN